LTVTNRARGLIEKGLAMAERGQPRYLDPLVADIGDPADEFVDSLDSLSAPYRDAVRVLQALRTTSD